eukprot:RCo002680
MQDLRHKKKPCKLGVSCSEKEAIHYLEFSHLGKLFPCRMGCLCTLTRDKEHMNSFSHPCWYHQDCRDIKDPEHCRRYTHEQVPVCKFAKDCTMLADYDHVSRFYHPDVRRFPCHFGEFCTDTSFKHRTKYLHASAFYAAPCDIRGLNRGVDFGENCAYMLSAAGDGGKPFQVDHSLVSEIRDYLPCHRLNKDKFVSAMNHGYLLSKVYQEELGKDPVSAASKQLQGHPMFHKLLSRCQLTFPDVRAFVHARLEENFTEAEVEENRLTGRFRIPKGDIIRMEEMIRHVKKTTESHKFSGIGYAVDHEVGTDSHVFCIVGPHTGL